MNKKSWLIVGLSLAMAASIGVGISACGGETHTHSYTKWQYNADQHWKVCPVDDALDPAGKSAHDFKDGKCVCGATEGGEIPDADLDTRVFYVVGSGAGDLKSCSFTELIPSFQLTKQPKKDENGYTVYKTAALTLYAGDTMKIVQDLKWDEGLGYFGVSNIKNNDGSLVDGGGPGNITPAVGKDGKYIFTVRTKPDITFAECTLEFELVEPVAALTKTEEIYIVGVLKYYDTKWPSGRDVTGCKKLDYDETTKEWSITVRLGGTGKGKSTSDMFKLYNSVNGKYIPDGTGNNWTASGNKDGKNSKASGDYKISWKTGELDITFTKLEHTHLYDDIKKDDTQHWNACWLEGEEEAGSRTDHVWENDQDEKCDFCGQTRHVHKYTKQNKDATQHWMECPTDGTISPEGKTNHVFDQEGGTKCVCGAEKADDCAHDGKILFEYHTADSVPAGVADGGTVTGKCEKCGNPVEVPYDKYVEYDAWWSSSGLSDGHIVVIEDNKTYYGKRTSNYTGDFMFIGYEVKAAGTLTLTTDIVFNNEDGKYPISFLYMETLFPSAIAFDADTIQNKTERKGAVVWKGKYSTNASNTALVTKWKEQIVFDEALGTDQVPLNSVTFTFTEEDVGTYLYISIMPNGSTQNHTNAATLLYVNFAPASATALVAPQEVAMLPEKKD